MKRLEFLTGTWGLKLLALLLAIVLYHAVKQGVAEGGAPAPNHERTLQTP